MNKRAMYLVAKQARHKVMFKIKGLPLKANGLEVYKN